MTVKSLILSEPDFDMLVKNSASSFVSRLCNKNIVTKSQVQEIVTESTEFLGSGYISLLKYKVVKVMSDNQIDSNTISNIQS